MLYIAVIIFAVLLSLLLWSLRNSTTSRQRAFPLEGTGRSNLQYFPQIHQALAIEDRRFLLAHGSAKMARTVYRERREVALDFLRALEEEFDHLVRLATVIADFPFPVAGHSHAVGFRCAFPAAGDGPRRPRKPTCGAHGDGDE